MLDLNTAIQLITNFTVSHFFEGLIESVGEQVSKKGIIKISQVGVRIRDVINKYFSKNFPTVSEEKNHESNIIVEFDAALLVKLKDPEFRQEIYQYLEPLVNEFPELLDYITPQIQSGQYIARNVKIRGNAFIEDISYTGEGLQVVLDDATVENDVTIKNVKSKNS